MWGLLSRCGPLSVLAATFLLTIGGLFVGELQAVLVGLAIEAVLIPILVGRAGIPPLRLLPGIVAMVSVTWSNWLLAEPRSWEIALLAGGRVAFFVLPALVLVCFLDPFTLGDHLGQRLRLPARPVLAAVAALQRLESLSADWETLDRARRVRGLGPGRGPLARGRHLASMTLALLVEAVRQAGRMTVAMEARGYSAHVGGGRPRTWLETAPWTREDSVLIGLITAVAAVPALIQLFG
ncbi:energy-coupling factor transporter transmembrane component T family protein [Gephyromycinifex aptenodytis]|uniref:energy-coupling factor transporter transmembrane component T family protein n=1 Tax=Gephyromycinifex aptenodytis TaxID=2716227 RepID=UPI001444FE4A|nr:energy-coupling factor transporter transmembrane component T [Gephyromycinifex aptenodytis]